MQQLEHVGYFYIQSTAYAVIKTGDDTQLYDEQGLHHLIECQRQQGSEAPALSHALARLNSMPKMTN